MSAKAKIASTVAPWLLNILSCPLDGAGLTYRSDDLVCENGDTWPVIGGVPVLLRSDASPAHSAIPDTLAVAQDDRTTIEERDSELTQADLFRWVEKHLTGTHGHLYRRLRGSLTRFPIPQETLAEVCPPGGQPGVFLDVGSHWGRWALAAASLGWRAVGLDPSLRAAIMGRRIAQMLSLDVAFVAGDARCLPFKPESIGIIFSYSVLQHMSRHDVGVVLREIRRVCRRDGRVLVQMPNRFGLRQLFNAVRQRVNRDSNPFRIRYWSPRELKRTFATTIGPTSVSVDGFFSLNPRLEDLDLLPFRYAPLLWLSQGLRRLSSHRPFGAMAWIADSLWVDSRPSPD